MTSSKDLNIARKALVASLGDTNAQIYFDKIKLWFHMKTTKEEFDAAARNLMSDDQVHLHNEFLLCLFNKVRGLAGIPPPRITKVNSAPTNAQALKEKRLRLKRKYKSDKSNFEPADVYAEVLSQASSPVGDEPTGANRSSAQELVLPDRSYVLARLMLAAWVNNMDGAEDNTAHIIMAATHIFLKNILTAMVTRRKGFSVRDESFIYNIGETVPSSWKRNTSAIIEEAKFANPTIVLDPAGQMPNPKMCIEEAEQAAAFALACSRQTLEAVPRSISIVDLQQTLRVHKNLVNNHTIYATNKERLFTYNTHSTIEDLDAQKLLL